MLNTTNHGQEASQTTVRYNLTPERLAVIKQKKITSVGEDMEKRELLKLLVGI